MDTYAIVCFFAPAHNVSCESQAVVPESAMSDFRVRGVGPSCPTSLKTVVYLVNTGSLEPTVLSYHDMVFKVAFWRLLEKGCAASENGCCSTHAAVRCSEAGVRGEVGHANQ